MHTMLFVPPDFLFKIGTRVHSILYGGRDGTVFAIRGEQNPATVRHQGPVASGGTAEFDIVFDEGGLSRGLPEAILRGTQWRVIDRFDSMEMIAQRLLLAGEIALEKENEVRRAAEAKAAERLALPGKFPFLKVSDGTRSAHALGATNLRIHLKREFPGVVFRITSDRGLINVTWTLGPTDDAVDRIADLYQTTDFDSGSDLHTYRSRVWPEIFGGAQFVHTTRDYGAAREVLAKALCTDAGVPYAGQWTQLPGAVTDVDDIACRLLRKQTFPVGAVVTGLGWSDDRGQFVEFSAAAAA